MRVNNLGKGRDAEAKNDPQAGGPGKALWQFTHSGAILSDVTESKQLLSMIIHLRLSASPVTPSKRLPIQIPDLKIARERDDKTVAGGTLAGADSRSRRVPAKNSTPYR